MTPPPQILRYALYCLLWSSREMSATSDVAFVPSLCSFPSHLCCLQSQFHPPTKASSYSNSKHWRSRRRSATVMCVKCTDNFSPFVSLTLVALVPVWTTYPLLFTLFSPTFFIHPSPSPLHLTPSPLFLAPPPLSPPPFSSPSPTDLPLSLVGAGTKTAGRTEEGGTAEESGRNATAAEKAHGGEEVPEVAGSTQL